ncbi:MAG: bile acid:sodium symporter [Spirochaetaceae bacterium]|jgi:ACR3 family arsenite efflux pump ArsB|nr:bile acid:sodium symporter [Spirochaetaceae bacterium]
MISNLSFAAVPPYIPSPKGRGFTAVLINFVWNPVFAFLLARCFLSRSADLQIGFMMLMVTPCTDWYLIFTGLARGNTALGSSILPLNLVSQIVLLPVYLLLFMGEAVSFTPGAVIQSIVLVLVIPMAAANLFKIGLGKAGGEKEEKKEKEKIRGNIMKRSDDLQFVLLCCAIITMFASQSGVLLSHLPLFLTAAPPILIFFALNGPGAFLIGQAWGLPFQDRVALVFTTSARNSPVALAIAAVTFPERPVIGLILVMGPLLELPLLGINAAVLSRLLRPPAASGT